MAEKWVNGMAVLWVVSTAKSIDMWTTAELVALWAVEMKVGEKYEMRVDKLVDQGVELTTEWRVGQWFGVMVE